MGNSRGAYDSATTYNVGNMVAYNNQSHASLVANNLGNQPDTSTDKWSMLANISNLPQAFASQSQANPQPGIFNTVATSPTQASFPYKLPLPNAIATTLGARAGYTVYVTDFASCTGNNAVDDSVGINAAISAVSNANGGTVYFPNAVDCRIQNPIIMRPAVRLQGPGSVDGDSATPNPHTARIQAAANMIAMIGQADYTTYLDSPQIVGLDIESSTYTMSDGSMIDLAAINAYIHDSILRGGSSSGDCLHMVIGTSTQIGWVNWVDKNTFGGCSGYGIYASATDSWITNNYISCDSAGSIYIAGGGNNSIIGNQIEKESSAVGLTVETQSQLCPDNYGTPGTISGNRFTLNSIDIYLKNPTGSTCASIGMTIGPNSFWRATTENIKIDDYISYGTIEENFGASAGALPTGETSCFWERTEKVGSLQDRLPKQPLLHMS